MKRNRVSSGQSHGLNLRKTAMKSNALAAAVVMAACVPAAFGTAYTSSVSQGTGGSYNTTTYWSPTGLPGPGDTAEVLTGGIVRTESGVTSSTFGSSTGATSLTIDGVGTPVSTANGQLKLREGGTSSTNATVTINHLIMNGGEINSGDTAQYTLPGQVTFSATSVITNGVTSTNTSNPTANTSALHKITLTGLVEGSATVRIVDSTSYTSATAQSDPNTATGNASLVISRSNNTANTFSGTWEIDSGYLLGKTAGSLGTNAVNFNLTGQLVNDAANGNSTYSFAPATFETDYDLDDSLGAMTITTINNEFGYKNFVLRLDQNWTFGALTVNGFIVPTGTYTKAQLIALNSGNSFSAKNFAAGTSGTANAGTITVVPEPASICLLGLVALALTRKRRGT